MKRCLFILMTLGLLGGCAHMTQTDRYWLPKGTLAVNDAVSLLHYAAYVRSLSWNEREREVGQQRNAFARDKSDFRRLQYAFAMSAPNSHASERSRALQLLQPLLDDKSGHDADLVALASLQAANLRGQRHGDDLEKKLNAVKGIERNLMQRGR